MEKENKREESELKRCGALNVGFGSVDYVYYLIKIVAVLFILAYIGVGAFLIYYAKTGITVTIPEDTPAAIAAQISATLAQTKTTLLVTGVIFALGGPFIIASEWMIIKISIGMIADVKAIRYALTE